MTAAASNRFKNAVPALVVLVTALVVRLACIHQPGLEFDEAQTLAVSSISSFHEMLSTIMLHGQCALFYILVRFWSFAFGSGDISARTLCVLISTAIPVFIYFTTCKRLGRTLAFSAATLCALSPTLVMATIQLRPYGLATLLSLLLFEQLNSLLKRSDSWSERLKYALLLAAYFHTHVLTDFVPIAQAAVIGWGWWRGMWKREQVIGYIIAASIGFICFVPWAVGLGTAAKESSVLWQQPVSLPILIVSILFKVFAGVIRKPNTLRLLATAAGSVVIVATSLIVTQKPRELPHRSDDIWWYAMNRTCVAGLICAVVMFSLMQRVSGNYLVPIVPYLLVLFAAAVQSLMQRYKQTRFAAIAPFAALIVCMPFWASLMRDYMTLPFAVEPGSAQAILKQIEPQRDLVVCMSEPYCPALSRELPDSIKVVSYPDVERVRLLQWYGIAGRIRDEQRMELLHKKVEDTLAQHGRIWLVKSVATVSSPAAVPAEKLSFEQWELIHTQQFESWLNQHARPFGSPVVIRAQTAAAEVDGYVGMATAAASAVSTR